MTSSSTIPRGVLVRLQQPSQQEGRLTCGDFQVLVHWLPSRTSWPRVVSAKHIEDPVAARARLRAIAVKPEHPLEASAALHYLARRADSGEEYIALQEQRASRAQEEGLIGAAIEAWTLIAFARWRDRNFLAAEGALEKAKALVHPSDDRGRAQISYIESHVLHALGLYRRALVTLEQAHSAAVRNEDRVLLGYVLNEKGIVLSLIGRHEEALEALEQLGALLDGMPEALRLHYLVNRGYFNARRLEDAGDQEDYDTIIGNLNAALALAQKLDMQDEVLNIRLNIAYAWVASGRLEKAQRSLAGYRTGPKPKFEYGQLFADELQARILLRDQPRRALARFRSVGREARREASGRPSEFGWRARQGEGLAHARMRRPHRAQKAFLEAFDELEALGSATDIRESRGPFFEARQRAYDEASRAMLELGDIDAAFVLSERSRSYFFGSLLRSQRLQTLPDRDRIRLESIRKSFRSLRAARSQRTAARRLVSLQELEDFDEDTRALDRRVARTWDELFELSESFPTVSLPIVRSLDQITEALRSDEVIVSCSRPEGRTRFFVLGSDGRVESYGRSEKVINSLPDETHFFLIPSPCMSIETLTQTWIPRLVVRASVSIIPSVSLLLRDRDPSKGSALVVGDPEQNLPWARSEARWVADQLGVSAHLGGSADRELLSTRFPSSRLFHFSGHGTGGDEEPWEAGLRLARGQKLRLSDLLVQPASPEVVVLSGCETGLKTLGEGRFHFGLAEAFLVAGSRAVLATTRRVGDREAQRFVRAFYRGGGARSPVQGYREAALEFLKKGEKNWSAFYIGGSRT